jgi:hypothetical protein
MTFYVRENSPFFRAWYTRPLVVTVVLAVLVLAGCSRSNNVADRPVARVEDQAISLADLRAATNLNVFSTGESAEDWIDGAVLAYHARKSDFALEEGMGQRLHKYQQRLLSNLFLDSLLAERVFINPEAARFYYADNIDTFRFRDSAALVYHFGFRHLEDSESALGAFRSSPADIDSVMNSYHYDRQLVYRGQLIPLFENTLFSASPNAFVGPIKSDFGYHLFNVERFFREGDAIPYAFVRKYIFEKLFQRRLPLERLAVLDSLREVTNIEISNE